MPSLLPGLTAFQWRRIVRWMIGVAVVLVALGVAGAFVATVVGEDVAPIILLVAIPGGVLAFIGRSLIETVPRERREVAAGYTTLPGRYSNLPQLHPITGAVLRQAGRQPLSEKQFRE